MVFQSLQFHGLLYLDMNSNKFPNDDVKGNPSYAPILKGKLAWQEKRKLEGGWRAQEGRGKKGQGGDSPTKGSDQGAGWTHLTGPNSSGPATPQEAGSVTPPTSHTAQQLSQRLSDLPRSSANKSTGSSDCQIPEILRQHHGPEMPCHLKKLLQITEGKLALFLE